MERLDGARRIGGLAWVGAGLLFGIGWALAGVVPGVITLVVAVAVVGLAAVVLARPAGPRGAPASWWGGWVVAVLLAADFAGAVADRFGAFGRPGAPGVSWGSWSAFVDYTRTLLHHPPEAVAVVAAVGGTATQVALAGVVLPGPPGGRGGEGGPGPLTLFPGPPGAPGGLSGAGPA